MSLPQLSSQSLNQIFWGPPGTGKTFKLISLKKHFTDEATNVSSESAIINWISKLTWWETIAATLIDLNKPSSVQDIMEHQFMKIKISKHPGNKTPRSTVWGTLQSHTIKESKTVSYKNRQNPYIFDKSENSEWFLAGNWQEELADLIDQLNQIRSPSGLTKIERFEMVTFHQSYSYEEFVEGIRPVVTDNGNMIYEIQDGIFKQLCNRASLDPNHDYAIFIDEINRGNISKIFGELITLIEPDKRKGSEHEVEVTLPYSKTKFSVPKNLYIIGTMNSVDRSTALVDMALRRRFKFVPIRPDATLVKSDALPGVNLKLIFERLNEKISVILGSEYQLGHSFFMGTHTQNTASFKKVWFGNILPLLHEYLFDDWEKLELLVGDFVEIKEVPGLEKLSLPRYSIGQFKSFEMSDSEFLKALKKLEG